MIKNGRFFKFVVFLLENCFFISTFCDIMENSNHINFRGGCGMKSLKTKILILILFCVLVGSSLNSFMGLYTTSKVLDEEANYIMNLLCQQNSSELDQLFLGIEQSVNNLALRAIEEVDDPQRLWDDEAFMKKYTESMEKASLTHAVGTEGASSVFLVFNPELTSPTAGFFWCRNDDGETFSEVPRTDMSLYDPSDSEHVGWYYASLENGGPTWMMPYRNRNIDEWIISYVVPLYKDGVTIGIIGMDVDFTSVEQLSSEIKLYETGYAFITLSDGTIMYHPEYEFGERIEENDKSFISVLEMMKGQDRSTHTVSYKLGGNSRILSFQKLRNEMYFCIAVRHSEINEERDNLIRKNIVVTMIFSLVSIGIAGVFARKLVKPLEDLNEATKKVVQGDWNVNLEKITNDEVGELTESFQMTLEYLNKYVDTIKALAYIDAMTGVRNKTAYQEIEKRINEEIKEDSARFAIVVFDVNNLKKVNDKYGHMAGDELIGSVCRYICSVFKKSLVYRVGGDEFVTILEADDFDNRDVLLADFMDGLRKVELKGYPEVKLSSACGMEVFDKTIHKEFSDVFKIADERMYNNKQEMKSGKNN